MTFEASGQMDLGEVAATIRSDAEKALVSALRGVREVAIVDFPSHQNVGDSMIFLGHLRLLEASGVVVNYVADASSYSPDQLRRSLPAGSILLTGGGNLGDLYPATQEFRHRVIADFGDRPIIQLPQSIHFQSAVNLDHASKLFREHADLTLMVRDAASLDAATTHFDSNRLLLSPDHAISLGQIRPTSPAMYDVLRLMRTDRERATHDSGPLPGSLKVLDAQWGLKGINAGRWKALRLATVGGARLAQRADVPPQSDYQRRAFTGLARLNLADAVAVFSGVRSILTDRLHASVLGVLLGKRTVALDNSYGKIEGASAYYLSQFPNFHLASTFDQAIDILMENDD